MAFNDVSGSSNFSIFHKQLTLTSWWQGASRKDFYKRCQAERLGHMVGSLGDRVVSNHSVNVLTDNSRKRAEWKP